MSAVVFFAVLIALGLGIAALSVSIVYSRKAGPPGPAGSAGTPAVIADNSFSLFTQNAVILGTSDAPLVFSGVSYNTAGSSLNTTTGNFTAPRAGIYEFDINVVVGNAEPTSTITLTCDVSTITPLYQVLRNTGIVTSMSLSTGPVKLDAGSTVNWSMYCSVPLHVKYQLTGGIIRDL